MLKIANNYFSQPNTLQRQQVGRLMGNADELGSIHVGKFIRRAWPMGSHVEIHLKPICMHSEFVFVLVNTKIFMATKKKKKKKKRGAAFFSH